VLSTRTRGFDGARRARPTIRGMSISRRVGFVGDSIQMSWRVRISDQLDLTDERQTLVFSCIAPSISSSVAISKSTNVVSVPAVSFATLVRYLNVPPYTSFTLSTCAFGPRDCKTVAVVALPEANAIACPAPASRPTSVRSNASRFGLPEREYSKPYSPYHHLSMQQHVVRLKHEPCARLLRLACKWC